MGNLLLIIIFVIAYPLVTLLVLAVMTFYAIHERDDGGGLVGSSHQSRGGRGGHWRLGWNALTQSSTLAQYTAATHTTSLFVLPLSVMIVPTMDLLVKFTWRMSNPRTDIVIAIVAYALIFGMLGRWLFCTFSENDICGGPFCCELQRYSVRKRARSYRVYRDRWDVVIHTLTHCSARAVALSSPHGRRKDGDDDDRVGMNAEVEKGERERLNDNTTSGHDEVLGRGLPPPRLLSNASMTSITSSDGGMGAEYGETYRRDLAEKVPPPPPTATNWFLQHPTVILFYALDPPQHWVGSTSTTSSSSSMHHQDEISTDIPTTSTTTKKKTWQRGGVTSRLWKRRNLFCFSEYRFLWAVRWELAVTISLALVNGLIQSARAYSAEDSNEDLCLIPIIALLVYYAIGVVLNVVFRPSFIPFVNALSLITNVCGVVAASAALVAIKNPTNARVVGDAVDTTLIALTVLSCLGYARVILDSSGVAIGILTAWKTLRRLALQLAATSIASSSTSPRTALNVVDLCAPIAGSRSPLTSDVDEDDNDLMDVDGNGSDIGLQPFPLINASFSAGGGGGGGDVLNLSARSDGLHYYSGLPHGGTPLNDSGHMDDLQRAYVRTTAITKEDKDGAQQQQQLQRRGSLLFGGTGGSSSFAGGGASTASSPLARSSSGLHLSPVTAPPPSEAHHDQVALRVAAGETSGRVIDANDL